MKTLLLALAIAATPVLAHESFYARDEVIHITPEWKGERFPDGRPKVSDSILDRMKNVTLEEAWATVRNAGYEHQYEGGWADLYPGKIMVGRALTSAWIPGRIARRGMAARQPDPATWTVQCSGCVRHGGP